MYVPLTFVVETKGMIKIYLKEEPVLNILLQINFPFAFCKSNRLN